MRNLIVNADDFGASEGVNRGIVDCHNRGVVTSTSLMVTGRAVDEAVGLAGDHRDLAVGLQSTFGARTSASSTWGTNAPCATSSPGSSPASTT